MTDEEKQYRLWSEWFKQYGVKVYDKHGCGYFILSEESLDSLYTDKDHGMDNLDYIEAKMELRQKAPYHDRNCDKLS